MTLDVETDVRDKAKAYWEASRSKKKIKIDNLSEAEEENEDEDEIIADKDPVDDFKTELQQAIANMSPTKFEQFARALLTKMGG